MQSLSDILIAQRTAFARGAPSYKQRIAALNALQDGLRQREDQMVDAVSKDFGGRSREETLLFEVFPLHAQVRHARRHLKKWMRQTKVQSAWFLQPSRAFFQYQPLGVIGVLGSWNFPFLLTLSPLIDALAAGNHVMLKPSETTPASAALLASLIANAFPPDFVACINGGSDLAQEFSTLPFDHILFTGSASVGKQVLRAAAANLTPVTLELGGKSPAIVHESFPIRLAAERIMTAKLVNAGQACLAPDYLLIPDQMELEFETNARRAVESLYPSLIGNSDYTRIVNGSQRERLSQLIEDASQKGARVVALNSVSEQDIQDAKVIPPTLIFSATDEMRVMQEEIFGPILPVITYRTIDEAISFVNRRPSPLALYYFDNNHSRVKELVARTTSGGVTINDCIFHFGQPNLPFGGVGDSGLGQYHGFDGFCTFSKKRGVMVQRRITATSLLHAPFRGWTKALVDRLLRLVRH